MAQGRKKQNVKLENALDTEAIEALETARGNAKKNWDADPKNKEKEKKFNRLCLLVVRFRKRIENRLATPKADVDLEELL